MLAICHGMKSGYTDVEEREEFEEVRLMKDSNVKMKDDNALQCVDEPMNAGYSIKDTVITQYYNVIYVDI